MCKGGDSLSSQALRRKQPPITKVACRPDVGGGSSSSDAAKMAEMAMQDTAMDDLEMDEMFDKHLEEHEAPFDDDQATGRSTRSRPTCSSATPSSTTWTTTDASMGDLENYEEAEYVPGSSLTPQAYYHLRTTPLASSGNNRNPNPGACRRNKA